MAAIFLLQTAAQPAGGNAFLQFLPMAAIFLIFWVLVFVPQRRQQKAHRELVSSLAKGDQVVTSGGVIGEIVQVKDDSILLRSGQSTLVVERARVARKLSEPAK